MKRSILIILAILLVPLFSRNVRALTFTSSIHKVYLPIVATPKAKFFAWAIEWDNRIPVQMLWPNARQERQYSCSAQEAAQFAAGHPGQLYIACDEPDINPQLWATATDYAVWYHNYVVTVRQADPTARFSPAGMLLTEYASAFYAETVRIYGAPPIVDEWRFHAAIDLGSGLSRWKETVNNEAEWSISHGAPMTLGSFGAQSIPRNVDISSLMWGMHDYIANDPRIVSAAWWSMDWQQWNHTLELPDGSLSPEGRLYSQWR